MRPGEFDDVARQATLDRLAEWRRAVEAGVRLRITIQGSNINPCELCEALAGREFEVDDAPMLPLPGCLHSPSCAAVFVPRVEL